jgi:ribosomal protein S18 acetylase RimI-like enzyme
VERVENWASNEVGADQITLTVESDNVPAQEFWKNKGYQTTLEKRVKDID